MNILEDIPLQVSHLERPSQQTLLLHGKKNKSLKFQSQIWVSLKFLHPQEAKSPPKCPPQIVPKRSCCCGSISKSLVSTGVQTVLFLLDCPRSVLSAIVLVTRFVSWDSGWILWPRSWAVFGGNVRSWPRRMRLYARRRSTAITWLRLCPPPLSLPPLHILVALCPLLLFCPPPLPPPPLSLPLITAS